MPGWIGPWEIAILLVVVLLVFGPRRLPELGRSLGKGMREFKESISGERSPPRADDHDDDVALPRPSEEERVSARERESGTIR